MSKRLMNSPSYTSVYNHVKTNSTPEKPVAFPKSKLYMTIRNGKLKKAVTTLSGSWFYTKLTLKELIEAHNEMTNQ